MLENELATDLPAEFAVVATVPLSDSDRRLTSVLGRMLDPDERRAYAELLAADVDDRVDDRVDDDFEHLPLDADEAARHDLATRMAAQLETLRERHPAALQLGSADRRRFSRTVEQVSQEIYNPAQLDVLRRVSALHRAARDRMSADPEG
ncbi:hypothetical protein [Pseudonocardia sp. NPDC046786]|uniref:hypothetical protein n=1 Tax=Pseudonocardia sp. NPDC046786 TaxID=3155471 RepID=UPI0033E58D43